MDIENLTLKQIKEISKLVPNCESKDEHPFEIGKNYLIRTVTMIITGKLVFVGKQELKLEEAAWIADTSRFSDSLIDTDKFNEVEPFLNPVIVGRGSIVDATIITKLQTKQK